MTELVLGEMVLVDESLSDYEALRVSFQVADERGHPGPSVVVDDAGNAITHPDYLDRMGTSHLRAGAWAFSRTASAEALGLPTGTDWIRAHVMQLMFEGGSPYRNQPHFYPQLYIQPFGDGQPHMMAPMCSSCTVAWSHDGSRICVLEERIGPIATHGELAKFVLWEYELGIGKRRRIAGFTNAQPIGGFTELSYSSDGKWILICDWAYYSSAVVRVVDGLVVNLPLRSRAVNWNPRAGASMMIVMTTDPESGNLLVYDYDLSADSLTPRCQVRPPHGLPLGVRELSMSVDERALVTASIGFPGMDQMRRGDVFVGAIVDIDQGEIEPVLSGRFRTKGAQRRHTSPRWCDDRNAITPTRTVVADSLLEAGKFSRCAPDSDALVQDHVDRWTESMAGIDTAWRYSTMPKTRFAQDFAQYAISCVEQNSGLAEKLLSGVRERARGDLTSRTVLDWIQMKYRLWSPILADPEPAPDHQYDTALEGELAEALDGLSSANDSADAIRTVRRLVRTAHRAGERPDNFWRWLAGLCDSAMREGAYTFVAKAALGTLVWNGFLVPNDRAVSAYGLSPTSPDEELLIYLSGHEACTHLPERQIVSRDQSMIYDVEFTRDHCQRALTRYELSSYLPTVARPKRLGRPATAAPTPTLSNYRQTKKHAMGRTLVFISYLRENSEQVDAIAAELQASGCDVWIDRTSLPPGAIWRREIRQAIRSGHYFIACFSSAYAERSKAYMNDELRVAVNELRLMPLDRRWFIPILLDSCAVPDFDIDWNTTLADLQCIDFSLDWPRAMNTLVSLVSAPS